MSWLSYALVEFRHSFKPPGRIVPGGRDFLSLTAVFTLLIAIVSISSALQRGIIINFADSLVGYAEGAGVPIRVALSPGIASNVDPATIASQFRNSAAIGGPSEPDQRSALAAYEFHPFVEVEANSVLFLPPRSWEARREEMTVEGSRVRGFYGWAAATGSPLWRWVGDAVVGKSPFSTIVLSRAIFADYFNRDEYEKAMATIAPAPMFDDWKRENPPGSELRSIIIQVPYTAVNTDRSREFETPYRTQLFQIAWVESFPAVQRIAFLLPLEALRVLDRASGAPYFQFIPEAIGESREASAKAVEYEAGKGYVGSVTLFDADKVLATPEQRAAFVDCLGQGARASPRSTELDLMVEFSAPVRGIDAERCVERSNIPKGRDLRFGKAFATPLSYDGRALRFACRDVPFEAVGIAEFEPCRNGATDATVALFGSLDTGFVYAPERDGIADLVAAVASGSVEYNRTTEGEPLFRQLLQISELYQNSIDRLTYLVKVVDYLVVPAALFFGIIVIYLIFIQIYVFLSKRKRNYGVLMARGMGWREIYKIIYGQFAASLIIGGLLALVLLLASKQVLHWSFSGSDAYSLGLTALGLKEPALLDRILVDSLASLAGSFTMSARDLIFGFVVVCAVVFPVLALSVWRLPVRPGTAPMELISL